MKLLLDTHALLWFATNDRSLSGKALTLIADPNNQVFLSVASVWELAIKFSIGKLKLASSFPDFIDQAVHRIGLLTLPIEFEHVVGVHQLPFHHRDPFDRMLIAQALTEGMPLVSKDPWFDAYGIARLW